MAGAGQPVPNPASAVPVLRRVGGPVRAHHDSVVRFLADGGGVHVGAGSGGAQDPRPAARRPPAEPVVGALQPRRHGPHLGRLRSALHQGAQALQPRALHPAPPRGAQAHPRGRGHRHGRGRAQGEQGWEAGGGAGVPGHGGLQQHHAAGLREAVPGRQGRAGRARAGVQGDRHQRGQDRRVPVHRRAHPVAPVAEPCRRRHVQGARRPARPPHRQDHGGARQGSRDQRHHQAAFRRRALLAPGQVRPQRRHRHWPPLGHDHRRYGHDGDNCGVGDRGAGEEPQGAGEGAGGAGPGGGPRPGLAGDGLPEPALPERRRQGVAPAAPADAAHAPAQGERRRQDRRLRHPQGSQRDGQRVGAGARPQGVGQPARVQARALPPREHRHQGLRLPRAAVRCGKAGVPRRAARHQPRGVHGGAPPAPLHLVVAGRDPAGGPQHDGVSRARHFHGHAAAGPRHAAPRQGGPVQAGAGRDVSHRASTFNTTLSVGKRVACPRLCFA